MFVTFHVHAYNNWKQQSFNDRSMETNELAMDDFYLFDLSHLNI